VKPSVRERLCRVPRTKSSGLGEALREEDRAPSVVRRDALGRDEVEVALGFGVTDADRDRLDSGRDGQLAGEPLQGLREVVEADSCHGRAEVDQRFAQRRARSRWLQYSTESGLK